MSASPLRPRPGVLVSAATPGPRLPMRALDLFLDGNEGGPPAPGWLAPLADAGAEALRRYPDVRALEACIAERFGLDPAGVLVTAGADEALDRLARAFLGPGRELVLPVPTFEMLARYAELSGARVREVPWEPGTPFPTEAVLAAVTPETGVLALVSPNNPTGTAVAPATVHALASGAPGAVLLVDQAYAEFADVDLTATALAAPNALVVRTLSKARGLAGLRVGYALGAPELVEVLRRAGGPFTVAGPSLLLARHFLATGEAELERFVARVREERERLVELATALGDTALASQGNFVLWRARDARWLADALAGLGIAVRTFPRRLELARDVRISCPGSAADFARLEAALRCACAPEALLLDMDGVLVDATDSYDATILAVAAELGGATTRAALQAERRAGGANDDVVLLARLLARAGRFPARAELQRRFEARYWGPDGDGLCREERPLVARAPLARLAARLPLAIVTGRPRRDAERFLAAAGLADLLPVLVCSEDAPRKPEPAPVRLALARLGVARAWLVGDTVDDVRAARAAGCVPLGLVAPLDERTPTTLALLAAGAARVLDDLSELESLLP